MKSCPCKTSQPTLPWRRGAGIAGWILPIATLILIPKCPGCVALMVLAWTGVGISVSTAAQLRSGLVFVCGILLLYFGFKTIRRLASRSRRA